MKRVFSSRTLRCKTPYGAVKQGREIELHIYPPRYLATLEATLIVTPDGGEPIEFPMAWEMLCGYRDCWGCTYQADTIGLFWYCFRMRGARGVSYISRGFGGYGEMGVEVHERFQLTVFDGEYKVPEWFGKSITYNIFPDRFYRTQIPAADDYPAERHIHRNWGAHPDYRPDARGEILNNDFFGGNLKGITEKLNYLSSLRIRTIYLNPIFEAFSNHRYDTGDYKKIDPILGTENDFKTLCIEAKHHGIRIVLDGVFNHTGYDSRYFNGRGHYDSVGAHQSMDSPYYSWFSFSEWPNRYSSWWGIYTLPQTNENNPDFREYIIDGPDSVIRHWLRMGASGWRLDVADELPDDFIAALNRAVKEEKKDAIVMGEVWEDASNKISYSERRKYFQGGELDSVMNYPLRDSILSFLEGGSAEMFRERMETIQENYPRAVYYNLMNIIGTHDTPRIMTVLGADNDSWNKSRQYRAQYHLRDGELERARRRLCLAASIQFTMPGSPCIYYGDEVGMEGFEDPFNRGTYPWGRENKSVLSFYQALCGIRDESPALQEGALRFLHADGGLLIYERRTGEEIIVVVVNRERTPQQARIPFLCAYDLIYRRVFEEVDEDGVLLDLLGESMLILRCAGELEPIPQLGEESL